MLPAPLSAFPERISIGWVQRVAADQNVHPIIVLRNSQDLWIGVSRDLLITS